MLEKFRCIPRSIRAPSSAFSSAAEFRDPIREQAESFVARKRLDAKRGKVQTWLKPVYVAPIPHIFEQSPDFSFKDGRPVHVTSQKQLDHKLEQIRLAKKMVALLKETEEVQRVYKISCEEREHREKEELAKRPIAKGVKSID
uniref:39S ribosomal protein L52, mitochondrial n=1 Tax=Caenorhabditis japonica TaxID=281687 RepID=A0A8R1I448_CAEJA